jgi:alkylhydroperoxidase family enzyme
LVRIAPVESGALSWQARAAARVSARATHGEPPHVLTTLGRHRRLFRRWLPFAAWLLLRTELPRVDVELTILRVAWNSGSWYEWAQHVPLAARAGVGPDERRAVPDGPAWPGWTGRQRVLVQAADELHEHRAITDATWASLVDLLSDRELIELCFVVGHYELLAMTLNSLGVQPEDTALRRLNEVDRQRAFELRDRLAAAR